MVVKHVASVIFYNNEQRSKSSEGQGHSIRSQKMSCLNEHCKIAQTKYVISR